MFYTNAQSISMVKPNLLVFLASIGIVLPNQQSSVRHWLNCSDSAKPLAVKMEAGNSVMFGILDNAGHPVPYFLSDLEGHAKLHMGAFMISRAKEVHKDSYQTHVQALQAALEPSSDKVVKNQEELVEKLKPYVALMKRVTDQTASALIKDTEIPAAFYIEDIEVLHTVVQVLMTQRDRVKFECNDPIPEKIDYVIDPLLTMDLLATALQMFIKHSAQLLFPSPQEVADLFAQNPVFRTIYRDTEPEHRMSMLDISKTLYVNLSNFLNVEIPRAFTPSKHTGLSMQFYCQLFDNPFKEEIKVETRAKLSVV
jgi:hypothetical protein